MKFQPIKLNSVNGFNIRSDTTEMITTYLESRAGDIIQNVAQRSAEIEKSEREAKKHIVYNEKKQNIANGISKTKTKQKIERGRGNSRRDDG